MSWTTAQCAEHVKYRNKMIIRASILIFCVGVIVTSGALLQREFRVTYLLHGTTNDQIETFAGTSYRLGIASSARTLRDILSTCARLKLFAPRLKEQPEVAKAVRLRCAEMAAQVMQRAPSSARARALAVLMAPALSAADLADAQRAAPYEPWPLWIRLSAIGATGPLEPDLQRLALADFARALESNWGRAELAKLYAQREDLRPLFQEALKNLAAADQTDFIRLARRTISN